VTTSSTSPPRSCMCGGTPRGSSLTSSTTSNSWAASTGEPRLATLPSGLLQSLQKKGLFSSSSVREAKKKRGRSCVVGSRERSSGSRRFR
jgi:hypothetical protein